MADAVELDDVTTWPTVFRTVVEARAANSEKDDLFDPIDEKRAIQALDGERLRVYHCTRLTKREVDSVRSEGLKPLSVEFTQERIRSAVADGHLTEVEGAFYGQTTLPRDENRSGMVWLFTKRASLSQPAQIGYLVEVWGGEGINMALSSRSPEIRRLERVGTPSVVIAVIDLSRHCDRSYPGVLAASVRHLRYGDGGTSIMCRSIVGPECIESIQHPGGEFWERHVWSPSSGFLGADA